MIKNLLTGSLLVYKDLISKHAMNLSFIYMSLNLLTSLQEFLI